MGQQSIYQILIGYLNMTGISLVSAFLIAIGLKWIFPKKIFFQARFIFGTMFVLMGLLLLVRFLLWFH